jgi:hypothetical protein
MFAPSWRASQQSADAEASFQLERARRILSRFDASLARKARLVARLQHEGVEVAAEDLADALAKEYETIHDRLWAAYPPVDWRGDRPSPARPNYGDIAGLVSLGLAAHEDLARSNVGHLAEALTKVDEALNVTVGDASSRSHAEANRLKAGILYYQALVEAAEGSLLRSEAQRNLDAVAAAAIRAAEAVTAREVVAKSTIDEHIADLEAKSEALRVSLETDRKTLHDLDAHLGDLEARLAAAVARRDAGLVHLEELKDRGAVFGDPASAEAFARDMQSASAAYRAAYREAHAIEHGTLAHARIAPGHDELLGAYVGEAPGVSPEPVRGLVHLRHDRTILAAQIEGRQGELDDLRNDLNRLDGIRASVLAKGRTIEQSIEDAARSAREAYAELNRLQSEAENREDTAARLLDQAARTAEQAATAAEQWVRDAGDRTRDLSPAARERSGYNARTRDGWMGGAMLAQAADARLMKASILYQRFDAHVRTASVLARLLKFTDLKEIDPAGEQNKADAARAAGVEEIQAAMNLLQKAHGKADRHWTLTAQAAAANDLMAMFGFDEYTKDALDAYRAAIKGREGELFAAPFVRRTTRLEKP